jgi:hypothetical protein
MLLSGARAARDPLGGLGQGHQPGYLLADIRILVRARLLRAIDDEVHAAGALRIPFVGLTRFFGFDAGSTRRWPSSCTPEFFQTVTAHCVAEPVTGRVEK